MDEILAALDSIENSGSFYTEKKINANKLAVKINRIGELTFPVSDNQIEQLIKVAKPAEFGWKDKTILDENVRKVWKIAKSYVRVSKKEWDKVMTPILKEIQLDLGLPKNAKLTSDFHDMLVYEPGCFFKPHQDSEKIDGMVATMVMILPTEYEGGELIVEHHGKKKIFSTKNYKVAKHSIAAFYSDCYHEVKPITSGYRVALTYNLVLKGYKGSIKSIYDKDFSHRLETAVKNHFNKKNDYQANKLVYLLDHQYTQSGISWSHLKNNDNTRVNELLKIADNNGFEAYLTLANVKEQWDCEFDYNDYKYRHYYEDDEDESEPNPTYILDTEVTLRHWMDRDDHKFDMKDYVPDSSSLCWTNDNDEFEPYDSEHEGWMGNYGNTLDRWYHRAALVMWEKKDHYSVVFEIDQNKFISEIFTLMNDHKNKAQIIEMMEYASEYWCRYADNHKSKDEVLNVINLCLYLEDNSISQNLLSAYKLEIINKDNIGDWDNLIQLYGYDWFVSVFDQMTKNSKSGYYAKYTLENFDQILNYLNKKSRNANIIDYLCNYQYQALISLHKKSHQSKQLYKKNANIRAKELCELLSLISKLGEQEKVENILSQISEKTETYPTVELSYYFALNVSDYLKDTNYVNKFKKNLLSEIEKEYLQGLREKNNWSITERSSCRCDDCQKLNEFLKSDSLDRIVMSINESARCHVARQIDDLYVPVVHKEERTGRPYKIILFKTKDLYKNAETRYKNIQLTIDHLSVNNVKA